MEKKLCITCNEEKLLSDFYVTKNRKSGQSKCKECFNKYCVQRWVQRKIYGIKYLGSTCVDCGKSYPEQPYVIFDFHHLNPTKKDVD